MNECIWRKDTDRENPKCWEKNQSQSHFSHHKSHYSHTPHWEGSTWLWSGTVKGVCSRSNTWRDILCAWFGSAWPCVFDTCSGWQQGAAAIGAPFRRFGPTLQACERAQSAKCCRVLVTSLTDRATWAASASALVLLLEDPLLRTIAVCVCSDAITN